MRSASKGLGFLAVLPTVLSVIAGSADVISFLGLGLFNAHIYQQPGYSRGTHRGSGKGGCEAHAFGANFHFGARAHEIARRRSASALGGIPCPSALSAVPVAGRSFCALRRRHLY